MIMRFILIFFAILGFFFVARQLVSLLLFVMRCLVSILPRLASTFVYLIRRFVGGLFQLASGLIWTVGMLFVVFRRTVSSIATGLENLFGFVHEPRSVRSVPMNAVAMKGAALEEPHPSRLATPTAIARCWVVPTCVLGIFLALSGRLTTGWPLPTEWKRIVSANDTPAPIPRPPLPDRPVTGEEWSDIKLRYFAAHRPDWIDAGDTTSGDVRKFVLTSALWSSVDEAKKELQTKATGIMVKDFEQRHHHFLDPKPQRYLSQDRIGPIAVKEQFVEPVELDFGTMYRLSWLVEISPIVRTELYSNWKAAKVQNRVIAVGAGIALMTLMASAGVLFSRLKRVSRYGTLSAFAATSACSTLWIAAGAFVTNRLLC